MKIAANTSAFDTRFLRTLFCKVHQIQSKTEGPCRAWKRLNVRVRRRDTSGYWRDGSGHAYLNTGPIVISIGDQIQTRRLAGLFWHEMMHVYGYRSHRGGRCDAHPDYLDAICKGLPERPPLKQPKQTKKVDIVAKRYAAILTREQRWAQKLKRAQAALKKAQKERRVYEQRHNSRLAA